MFIHFLCFISCYLTFFIVTFVHGYLYPLLPLSHVTFITFIPCYHCPWLPLSLVIFVPCYLCPLLPLSFVTLPISFILLSVSHWLHYFCFYVILCYITSTHCYHYLLLLYVYLLLSLSSVNWTHFLVYPGPAFSLNYSYLSLKPVYFSICD